MTDAKHEAPAEGAGEDGDWIEWSGGENPIPGEMVEVRRQYSPHGGVFDSVTPSPSEDHNWNHDREMFGNGANIIAYRVRARSSAPAEGAGEWNPTRGQVINAICNSSPFGPDYKHPDLLRMSDAILALRARSSAPEAREDAQPFAWAYRLNFPDENTAWDWQAEKEKMTEAKFGQHGGILETMPLYTHPAHPSADHAELTRLAEAAGEEALGNLLAVIHGDGGHRALEVGTKQAALEAEKIVAGLFAAPSADKLRIAVEALEPFANLGVTSGPDDEPCHYAYRITRGAIRNARQALAALKAEDRPCA